MVLAVLGGFIGSVSFSGSMIAFGKLQGLIRKDFRFKGQNIVNVAILLVITWLGISVTGGQTDANTLALFFGLTLLLASSAAVFQFVKYAGAVYLVALGLYLLTRPRQEQGAPLERPTRDLWRVYSHAVMVNVLNPKVGIFFLAFFPQFVDPGRGEPGLQFLLLGAVLIGVVLVTDTLFALTAGVVMRLLRRQSGQRRWPQIMGGLSYIGLGIFSATIDPPAQG